MARRTSQAQARPAPTPPSGSSPGECTDAVPALPKGAPEGCWFDEAAAKAACDFFPRYLRHTEAEWAGKPFHLAPWQRAIVRAVFGWKRADGTRLYRVVYIEIPRKNGKTEFAAGLAILLLLADGEFGGQGYIMAVDKDQAKIGFAKARVMVEFSEALGKNVESLATSLFCPELMASFKPLSHSPGSKHGFSPSYAIADEIHVWPDGELADVVHKGTGARRQPLEIYITTAGVRSVGFGWEMHDRALKVRDGLLVDPSFLPVIHAAGDEDDWTAEETWVKANPNIGTSPKWEYLRAECAKAQESPRLENEFKRYHLNLWTEQVTRWLDIADWDGCAGDVPWQDLEHALKGQLAFGAVDLSSKVDLSALVYAFRGKQPGAACGVVARLYMPEDRVEFAEKRDRLPYADWIKQGAITTTPGNVVDYGFIEQRLMDDASRFQIQEVAFDPWNAMQFATRMMGEGMTMVEFRQGFGSMSEPAKEVEKLILSRKLFHGGHPVLREMAKAISIATDPAGNIKPDKSKATLRIDGIVAMIMAVGRGLVAPAPFRSVYEIRGIQSVAVA